VEIRDAGRYVIAREIAPIKGIRLTAEYRRRVSANLLGEFLEIPIA
jgi:xanthine dehydrogenase iron-sulfur cluster and FAD-binding subunit A